MARLLPGTLHPPNESWVGVDLHLGLFEVLLAAIGIVTFFALSVRIFWRRGKKP
jgi:hypothetical protein